MQAHNPSPTRNNGTCPITSPTRSNGLEANAAPDARVKVNPKHKPELAKVAKERQKVGGGDKKSGRAKLPEPIEDKGQARDQAGRIVGVSESRAKAAQREGGGDKRSEKAKSVGRNSPKRKRDESARTDSRAAGKWEFPKVPKDTNKRYIRDAGVAQRPRCYTEETLAAFLGKTQESGKPAEAVKVGIDVLLWSQSAELVDGT